jgi:large subunit ribosomal protein L20
MPRATSKSAGRQRMRKLRKANSGYFGKRKNCRAVAKDAFYHSGVYAFRDRRVNKRNFRSLWIVRINAAARLNGTTYGRLMAGLKKMNSELNRKALAHLALHEPETFKALVDKVKELG